MRLMMNLTDYRLLYVHNDLIARAGLIFRLLDCWMHRPRLQHAPRRAFPSEEAFTFAFTFTFTYTCVDRSEEAFHLCLHRCLHLYLHLHLR